MSAAPPPNQPPQAGFTVLPAAPEVGEDVSFSSTSTDADGSITGYEWDSTATASSRCAGQRVDPRLHRGRDLSLSLQVTDDDGDSDTAVRDVVVGGGPPQHHTCRGLRADILGTAGDDTLTGSWART